ncbi:hypothetical protein ABW19_dt0201438 [Dactylella cylindrospora]|nr:hypothetical protein ABW19_dt0201438 [Dactylella cylindrospora]
METKENSLENSMVLVIPSEDQEVIKNFWTATEGQEEENKTVEITLPETNEETTVQEATENTTTMAETIEETAAGPASAEAEVPVATAEGSTPAPAAENNETAGEPANTETATANAEAAPAEATTAEAAPEETTAAPANPPAAEVPAPAPAPTPVYRAEVPFRKACATCSNHPWRTRCYAQYCLACSTRFVVMYEDESNNEEIRATIAEEERPACNPGEDECAYCKECLLDWFDNCIAWPHREPLPKTNGHSMLPIVEPFVSKGYMERLLASQAYWDDHDKIFCPVPTCSTYVPRSTYTVTKEVEVIKPASVEEKKEEAKAEETPVADAPAAETPAAETPAAETPATEAPEAPTETPAAEAPVETPVTETPVTEAPVTAAPVTEIPATETLAVETPNAETPAAETPAVEAPVEGTTENEEPATEEKKEEEPAKEPEVIKEIVKKEFKSQIAVCPDPACRTPICTLCKGHFHGLDVPCASRTDFFKSFMLSKFANPEEKEEEKKEGEENNNEDENQEEEYDEYEEYPNRFRQCVNCQNLVARHTGCDHMTCACGYAFCFYCGGEYGSYHDCITEDDYKVGNRVGGIKITNEDGYLDAGAEVTVNKGDMLEKDEETKKIEDMFEYVEFVEEEVTKKVWKTKDGADVAGIKKEKTPFSEEEKERLGRPMKPWKGRYD